MINLQLDPNKDFSTKDIQLPYQEWEFIPAAPYEIVSIIGQPDPVTLALETHIKNYILSLGTDTYLKYYVKQSVSYSTNAYPVTWVAASGPIWDEVDPKGYLLTQGNLNITTQLAFEDLSQLSEDVYTARLRHKVYGELANGTMVEIDVIEYLIRLSRLSYYALDLIPFAMEFAHYIGVPLPASQTLSIFANTDFTLTVLEHLNLSGGNLVLDTTINGIKTYSGNGSQDVQVTLDISIETIGETAPDFYVGYIQINNNEGFTAQTQIKVFQYATGDYLVTPLSLEFIAVQNVLEAEAQEVTVQGYGNFTSTNPSWLVVSPSSGDNNATMSVVPIVSLNLVPGDYEGEIEITTTTGTFIVTVTHKVIGSVDIGISEREVNFTRDRETISHFYGEDTSNVFIDIEAITFNYGLLLTNQIETYYKKGLFNNRTNFFFGKIIEQIMFKLLSPEQIGLDYFPSSIISPGGVQGGTVYKYYNPSISAIAVYFKDRATGNQVGDTENYTNIEFIKGRKPARFSYVYGILDVKESPIRVTKNSITVLNMYRRTGFAVVEIYRNNVLVGTFNPENDNNTIFGMRLDFSTFTEGDIVEARYLKNWFVADGEVGYYSQKYIMFPEGKNSYHIGWENEHGVLDMMEFTGDYAFSSKYNEVIATTFSNFLEEINKYESDKELKFNANTGWILKSNQERIDSLVASNKSWIIFNENRKAITLVPRTSKITNVESDRGEYEYNVEFTINPQHEFENNTF